MKRGVNNRDLEFDFFLRISSNEDSRYENRENVEHILYYEDRKDIIINIIETEIRNEIGKDVIVSINFLPGSVIAFGTILIKAMEHAVLTVETIKIIRDMTKRILLTVFNQVKEKGSNISSIEVNKVKNSEDNDYSFEKKYLIVDNNVWARILRWVTIINIVLVFGGQILNGVNISSATDMYNKYRESINNLTYEFNKTSDQYSDLKEDVYELQKKVDLLNIESNEIASDIAESMDEVLVSSRIFEESLDELVVRKEMEIKKYNEFNTIIEYTFNSPMLLFLYKYSGVISLIVLITYGVVLVVRRLRVLLTKNKNT